jgi:2-dehydropantoate 2-reductase
MSEIGVLGPGGVGGLTAAALSRAGEQVTVVARERTARLIAREGIAVRSVVLGEFVGRPNAVTDLRAPVDVLIVAT